MMTMRAMRTAQDARRFSMPASFLYTLDSSRKRPALSSKTIIQQQMNSSKTNTVKP